MSFLTGAQSEHPAYPEFLNAHIREVRKRYLARRELSYAVAKGDMKPPTLCERCKKPGRPEGHHFDYDQPLNVLWLCAKCHRQEHARNGCFRSLPSVEALRVAWCAGKKHREAAHA